MANWIKSSIEAISAKGGIFMFIRAQLSSQLASLVDFLVSIILVSFTSIYYVYATVIGSVCGGIVNGIINYHWTFKATNVNKKWVTVRYTLVWIGSVLLNTLGVFLIMESFKNCLWAATLFDNIFMIAKIVVAIIVGFTWNYQLQRIFVYKGKNN